MIVIDGFCDWFFAVAIGLFAIVGILSSISFVVDSPDTRGIK